MSIEKIIWQTYETPYDDLPQYAKESIFFLLLFAVPALSLAIVEYTDASTANFVDIA